jgi:stalled ribosome rescue protein Dom34
VTHNHCVVWIDHAQARILSFNREEADETTIHASHPHAHLHHKAGSIGAGKADEDKDFLNRITTALTPFREILIIGPGNAKVQLEHYIGEHDPKMTKRVVGVLTADHPSDPQIIAMARRHFRAADRMRPQL